MSLNIPHQFTDFKAHSHSSLKTQETGMSFVSPCLRAKGPEAPKV